MTANTVHTWANWFLVVSLVIGVVSTFAIVVTGKIKERELKHELSQATVDAEKAKVTAAKANIKTANLNLKIEKESRKRIEAEIALDTLRAKLRNRSISIKQRESMLNDLRKLAGISLIVGILKHRFSQSFNRHTNIRNRIANA